MTCTDTHPHRPDLRRRAERLIAALDAVPAPQTLTDIIRAARALMIIDRLLGQLWKTPPAKSARQPVTAVAPDASPDDTDMAIVRAAVPPPNRHQRRLQAARERSARPDGHAPSRHETG
jgi:hypothetical protein